MSTLAIHGGQPVRKSPISPSGERFGDDEIALLTEVIRSQKLNCNAGTRVKEFSSAFGQYIGRAHSWMVTSGTAAIHVALGAANLNPGDEVITAPVTDMGTICPILMQNAIPVFADLEAGSMCLDPEDVVRRITPRTRVIMPVHFCGNACNMEALTAIAEEHQLLLIEDCAQAFNTVFAGRKVGTIGDIGCFSLNQSKHISCGDGGITVTDDPELGERVLLFSDKAWPRSGTRRDHLFLAPNYRVTELQAAVALAQLKKLDAITNTRRDRGDLITSLLEGAPEIAPMHVREGDECTYWFYWFRVPSERRNEYVHALKAEGLPASAGYIPKPVYLYDVLREKKTYGDTHFPYGYAPFRDPENEIDYHEGLCPVAERGLTEMIRFGLSEFWTEDDARDAAIIIRKVAEALA
ncbi:MAG: DegT/DnrJ/EryC1/StrS family aminotransferase [Lentisphaerae bacterium]|jgi:perosamine synthetase|nr:DegT/DnrJ/EryC1/StrS family aminotransferase [Lentisphaerota bacterium]MBT4817205.1 DegT/DnrJ/EryC1/StrS family aminotransferase [Lentisphaerota bacterium]MBT5608199.1 DegT/DnrJ/EryC1/StrS family aminotransferase [Lentisphaerota bacterium]MBT7058912.1 DegT/DnrJ/EryC1/StrS family aminotransferase [Lentisphaerota bacterium]MBT7842857.1 DegT/DnrJ/EryC1/StrS family aminotransferase [Lentisphaerota bacterium]